MVWARRNQKSMQNESTDTGPQLDPSSTGRGIPWIFGATFLFVTMDSLVKTLLRDGYDLPQVVWGRYFFHVLVLLIVLAPKLKTVARTENFGLQMLRSFLMLATTSLFFAGLQFVPLAEASAMMMISPLIVTALAMPVLGEQVGPRRWAGVVIGLIGALIIIRPGSGLMQLGILFPAAAACSYAVYQISTRFLSLADPILTTLFYTAIVGAVVTSFAAPFYWTDPTPMAWLYMVGAGLCGGIGHFALIKALTLSPVSVIAPYSYMNLIWATAFGFIIFAELPDTWTVAGAAIITASGLYVYHREKSRKAA